MREIRSSKRGREKVQTEGVKKKQCIKHFLRVTAREDGD